MPTYLFDVHPRAQGVQCTAYCPLGGAGFFKPNDLINHPTVQKVAAQANKTPAQVGCMCVRLHHRRSCHAPGTGCVTGRRQAVRATQLWASRCPALGFDLRVSAVLSWCTTALHPALWVRYHQLLHCSEQALPVALGCSKKHLT